MPGRWHLHLPRNARQSSRLPKFVPDSPQSAASSARRSFCRLGWISRPPAMNAGDRLVTWQLVAGAHMRSELRTIRHALHPTQASIAAWLRFVPTVPQNVDRRLRRWRMEAGVIQSTLARQLGAANSGRRILALWPTPARSIGLNVKQQDRPTAAGTYRRVRRGRQRSAGMRVPPGRRLAEQLQNLRVRKQPPRCRKAQ